VQEVLSGGSGLNLRQSDWTGMAAVDGSPLSGVTEDIGTWLPPTRDPFLFTIGGSIEATADRAALERAIGQRIAMLRDARTVEPRLAKAKATVTRTLSDDVQTTEDAAHQLAFFEGLGALDSLLEMPKHVAAVTTADLQRVASTYLIAQRLTVGWMIPGDAPGARAGTGNPRPAADRPGTAVATPPAGQPQLRKLSGGLPAVVQTSPLSNSATVELLLSAPVEGEARPDDLSGLGAIIRSGSPENLGAILGEAVSAAEKRSAAIEDRSEDPATRLDQLISARMSGPSGRASAALAAIVSGNIDAEAAFRILERQLGRTTPGKLSRDPPGQVSGPKIVRERIAKPLAQGGLGYVAEGPPPGTREALAWRMLLYVLTHDYSGRLGRSAITEKGIVYHIYSSVRTDGARSWATISTGVDPDKADAMEAELRGQLARLVSNPPSPAEVEAARNHLLGRNLTAAQSNGELTAKLAREFVETGGLRCHEQLRQQLRTITPADLAALVPALTGGTLMRVDVAARR
jgi:predicted Zn-dependent peptidase